MAAKVVKLRTRAARLSQSQSEELRQRVLEFAAEQRISSQSVNEIVATIDRETASKNGWTFVMISPEANDGVVEALFARSSRPVVAVRLWLKLFIHLRRDTGEVVQTRDELAKLVGISPENVSRIMTELEEIGAVIRRREGRAVKYFVNAMVGTHLAGGARDRAQAAAPKLRLVPTTD